MLSSVLIFAVSAMFLGLGLGRFAFSPMIPELVGHGWLKVAAAQSVGAANLIGYLLGALIAKPMLRGMSERTLCLASGGMIVLSYAMFLMPLGIGWFWAARLLAGVGGALLMVVGTAAAGRQLAALGRKELQPLLFSGIGLGALFVALCLPYLLLHGIKVSIVALMLFSAAALAALWQSSGFVPRERAGPALGGPRAAGPGLLAGLIILAYGCDALGFVMHTVYLPDMLRRIFGHTEAEVGLSWAFFGIGACFGPVFVMTLRRWLSGRDALCIALALKALGVALVLYSADTFTASLSLFMVGMLTPGMVILTSGALAAEVGPDRYLGAWALATALFALGQMVSGMVIAAISGQGYQTALILSVAVMLLGLTLAFIARCLPQATGKPQ